MFRKEIVIGLVALLLVVAGAGIGSVVGATHPSNTGYPVTFDISDPSPQLTYTDVPDMSGPGGYTGKIRRIWTSTDAVGNSTSAVQVIWIVDTTPPIVTCPPDVTIQSNESASPTNTGFATAFDAGDPNPRITYNDWIDMSGSGGYTGKIRRTWTATDASGNSASCYQTILIVDNIPPVLIAPPDVTIERTQFLNANGHSDSILYHR